VAYDPCYSLVDVILLATLGVRALRRGDPGVRVLINRIIGTQYAHSSSACGNSQTPHCSTRPVPSSPSSLMQSSARTQLSTSSFSGATRSGAAARRPTSVRFQFDPCGGSADNVYDCSGELRVHARPGVRDGVQRRVAVRGGQLPAVDPALAHRDI
jgi:hypothetical protein